MYAPDTARCDTTGEAKRQDYETCTMVAQPITYPHPEWLTQALCFFDNDRRDLALKEISLVATRIKASGDFESLSSDLSRIDLESLPEIVLIALLRNTYSARGNIPSWASLLSRAEKLLLNRNLDPASLLRGLKDFSPMMSPAQPVAFAQNQLGEVRTGEVFNTINTNSNASGRNTPMVHQSMAVRRLTAVECEFLQGFPRDYTNIPWRKSNESPDGPRYKALGNSMAVPCMRWIGQRIERTKQCDFS
jgi:DNA (cytosine-5)-methyltransferase 1